MGGRVPTESDTQCKEIQILKKQTSRDDAATGADTLGGTTFVIGWGARYFGAHSCAQTSFVKYTVLGHVFRRDLSARLVHELIYYPIVNCGNHSDCPCST